MDMWKRVTLWFVFCAQCGRQLHKSFWFITNKSQKILQQTPLLHLFSRLKTGVHSLSKNCYLLPLSKLFIIIEWRHFLDRNQLLLCLGPQCHSRTFSYTLQAISFLIESFLILFFIWIKSVWILGKLKMHSFFENSIPPEIVIWDPGEGWFNLQYDISCTFRGNSSKYFWKTPRNYQVQL